MNGFGLNKAFNEMKSKTEFYSSVDLCEAFFKMFCAKVEFPLEKMKEKYISSKSYHLYNISDLYTIPSESKQQIGLILNPRASPLDMLPIRLRWHLMSGLLFIFNSFLNIFFFTISNKYLSQPYIGFQNEQQIRMEMDIAWVTQGFHALTYALRLIVNDPNISFDTTLILKFLKYSTVESKLFDIITGIHKHKPKRDIIFTITDLKKLQQWCDTNTIYAITQKICIHNVKNGPHKCTLDKCLVGLTSNSDVRTIQPYNKPDGEILSKLFHLPLSLLAGMHIYMCMDHFIIGGSKFDAWMLAQGQVFLDAGEFSPGTPGAPFIINLKFFYNIPPSSKYLSGTTDWGVCIWYLRHTLVYALTFELQFNKRIKGTVIDNYKNVRSGMVAMSSWLPCFYCAAEVASDGTQRYLDNKVQLDMGYLNCEITINSGLAMTNFDQVIKEMCNQLKHTAIYSEYEFHNNLAMGRGKKKVPFENIVREMFLCHSTILKFTVPPASH